MESHVKIFRIFIIITIFLTFILLVSVYYFLVTRHPSWDIDFMTILFFLSFIIYLGNSIVVLLLIKKYPAQYISNTLEGLIYLFAILTFLFNLISVLFIYVFTENAFELEGERKKLLMPSLLFASISSGITTFCAAFTAINSFRILKIIKRNWWDLAKQIRNIGTGYE